MDSPSDDWKLLERAQKGSESSWQQLVNSYYPQLMRMSFMITGSMAASQDLVQESFVKLYYWKPKHRDGNLSSYLSTLVFRASIKEKNRRLKLVNFEDVDPVEKSPNPLSELLLKEREKSILEVIDSLDDAHREILILRFYGEHSYMEIAQILGLPVGTVKSRIFHAVKKCREGLHKMGLME